MEAVWAFLAQIGLTILNTFISDAVKRQKMADQWAAFIANRQSRADATVELKTNLDAQDADLDEIQKKLENEKANKPGGETVAKKAPPTTAAPGEAAWLKKMESYIGQHEIAGPKDNQHILDSFKHCDYKAVHDEIPWCAAECNRVLEETGWKGTRSAAANSFMTFGEKCELKPGAIVVFHWPAGGQHVSIVRRVVSPLLVECVGGNQSDMVKASTFHRSSIAAIRWPKQRL